MDSETGENIIHDGALFRIYAAKRDVKKAGIGSVTGTGQALFGPAVDHEGNKVLDTDGKASGSARWMKQAQKEAYSVLLPHCGK